MRGGRKKTLEQPIAKFTLATFGWAQMFRNTPTTPLPNDTCKEDSGQECQAEEEGPGAGARHRHHHHHVLTRRRLPLSPSDLAEGSELGGGPRRAYISLFCGRVARQSMPNPQHHPPPRTQNKIRNNFEKKKWAIYYM